MITIEELRQRLERGNNVVVLDVRQPLAYAEYPGTIPGSVRIPPAELPDRYGELPRDRLIVAYCT
jgi:adenylyltransferase/sulfurtransferase